MHSSPWPNANANFRILPEQLIVISIQDEGRFTFFVLSVKSMVAPLHSTLYNTSDPINGLTFQPTLTLSSLPACQETRISGIVRWSWQLGIQIPLSDLGIKISRTCSCAHLTRLPTMLCASCTELWDLSSSLVWPSTDLLSKRTWASYSLKPINRLTSI